FPVNKKTTATNGGSFAGIKSYQLFFPKVTGLEERSHQNLFFQFSLNRRMTSRTTPLNPLPVAAANGDFSCL
ncbi:hypothetical protein, partial [Salmonella enterica]|uniref:hypothetical protein n=1 Tax=Salmonella enterica TaxID=28901 RepID=UPI001C8F694D